MRIIPVIDLKQGQVVRGIGGRRDEYRPIASPLVTRATPGDVAQAFVEKLGLATVYVADLDAIAGAEPDDASYAQMAAVGAKLWIDAGAGNLSRAREVLQFADTAIIGLESLADPDSLTEIVTELTSARIIFSLDLKLGIPLPRWAAWRGLTPLAIAREAVACGITRMIVLDLAAVGSQRGPTTLELARALRQAFPQLELIGGGGVRDRADLEQLAAAGFDAALVASALHAGTV